MALYAVVKQLERPLLLIWFGSPSLEPQLSIPARCTSRWYSANTAFDDELRLQFGQQLAALLENTKEQHVDELIDREDLAAILTFVLLFDQVTRNIYRNNPRAYSGDSLARYATRRLIDRGLDVRIREDLHPYACVFLYYPLEHSELMRDQNESVERYGKAARECASLRTVFQSELSVAEAHRQLIAEFGRFPHRNAVLGRETSEEEQRALDEGRRY